MTDEKELVSRNLSQELIDIVNSDLPFTDLHIAQDSVIMAKLPDGWKEIGLEPVVYEDMEPVLKSMDSDWEKQIVEKAMNRPLNLYNWRLRINAFLAFGGTRVVMSIRRIPARPMPLKATGLPPSVRLMLEAPRGLILVSGSTGSGKSTTLSSMADSVNESRNAHIITIEDPIEQLHEQKKSIFSQREIGVDVLSFHAGIKDAMRQRPDVILIGEIRDRDTADAALLAAESGHLVMASIHANSASGAVQKMLAFFPSHERESREQMMAMTTVGVINQVLLPKADKSGYALAAELLFNHKHQFSKILCNPEKLASALSRKEDSVSRSLEDSLIELVTQKIVNKADALREVTSGQTELYDKLKTL